MTTKGVKLPQWRQLPPNIFLAFAAAGLSCPIGGAGRQNRQGSDEKCYPSSNFSRLFGRLFGILNRLIDAFTSLILRDACFGRNDAGDVIAIRARNFTTQGAIAQNPRDFVSRIIVPCGRRWVNICRPQHPIDQTGILRRTLRSTCSRA